RAVIGRTACQLLTQASTFDQEAGAEVLLKHRLHHRAATDVANTDTENLFHHPMMFRWLTPSSSGAKGRPSWRVLNRRRSHYSGRDAEAAPYPPLPVDWDASGRAVERRRRQARKSADHPPP